MSCSGNDSNRKKNGGQNKVKINPHSIFFDYNITGTEKDNDVILYIQYRAGGPNGPSIVLDDPASVRLDGQALTRDSAKLTGAYYEIIKPLESFTGRHILTFTDFDEKEYSEEFEYRPFHLETDIPAVLHRGSLAFVFANLDSKDYIRVTATDTSFSSPDINEIDTVIHGRLTIPTSKLDNLTDGPITIQFSHEIESPVTDGTRAGGRIIVSYGIEREFDLKTDK